jgi:hypothetical protein
VLVGESKGGDCLGDLYLCDYIIEMNLRNMTYDVGWIQLAEGKVQCVELFYYGDAHPSSINQELSEPF